MSASAQFHDAGLGQWTEEETFEVTAERIAAYAEATNDPIAPHRSGEVAPPVFAVVPTFMSLAPAALEVAPAELLGKLVHGEQDFVFHRPIRPGDVLTTRAKGTGYAARSTGSTVTVYATTTDAGGELLNEQWLTAFFRGVDAGATKGENAPGHSAPDEVFELAPDAVVTQHVDDDQTFRYSPASGDPMPIHLDEEIARLSGLPGIINHGLCTMAFTSWAALQEFGGGEVARLRRLAVRFARPVIPGNDITTSFWKLPSDGGDDYYAFQTESQDSLVIRDGLAVFSR